MKKVFFNIFLFILLLYPINTKALDKINILYYKYIDTCEYDTCIDRNLFLMQLKFLHSKGYKTITLDELEKWYNNEIELDNKSIVLVIENNNDSIAEMANTYDYQINELGNYKLFFNNESRPFSKNDSLSDIPVYLMKNINVNDFTDILNQEEKIENYDYSELAQEIPVLNYHFMYEYPGGCNEDICLNIKIFEEQLKYLNDNNYKILTMDEFVKWKYGELELPKKSILLTFDDGAYGTNKNNGNYLIPIIEKYNAYATLYLITSFWNIDDYISPNLEVQVHTHNLHNLINNNYQMALSNYDEIKKDLETSLEIVKDNKSFAYPFYYHNQDAINALKDLGFKVSFIGGNRHANRSDDNYLIPRYVILDNMSLEEFIKILEN